jgi:GDPmannose 4,6-dehydratase
MLATMSKPMWLMLQQEQCDDYVVATGKGHSISDFGATGFNLLGLDPSK